MAGLGATSDQSDVRATNGWSPGGDPATQSLSPSDRRIKRLMNQCGMPNSTSVYLAMKQLESEVFEEGKLIGKAIGWDAAKRDSFLVIADLLNPVPQGISGGDKDWESSIAGPANNGGRE